MWDFHAPFFKQILPTLPDHGIFVEVGAFVGTATSMFSKDILAANKNITIFSVDTFTGSPEGDLHANPLLYESIRKNLGVILKQGESFFHLFCKIVQERGVPHLIKPMTMTSVQASYFFADESVDYIFIDASHDYNSVLEDIRHWWPKLKPGCFIAGHDYFGCPGVTKAVDEWFHPKNIVGYRAWDVWSHQKTGRLLPHELF